MSDFTHLHVHTQYSILDGAAKVDDLLASAQAFGMDSLAITDHGNMLGALVMHGSGERFSPKGPEFAGQLIGMYTASMGSWTYWIISIAALTTMISTTLTTLDAYPRVILSLGNQLMPETLERVSATALYRTNIFIVAAGSAILVALLSGTMRFMVDLATTLSFITAPLLAWLNYKVVTSKRMPKSGIPPPWLRVYAIAGMVLLSGFTLFYVFWTFFH